MLLADTSIWVDHLRRGNAVLAHLLRADEVSCHAYVIGELACGSIRNRAEILRLLQALPSLPRIEDQEILTFIDRQRLMGKGLGLVDVHLLASCQLSRVALWTTDVQLAAAAGRLGLAPRP